MGRSKGTTNTACWHTAKLAQAMRSIRQTKSMFGCAPPGESGITAIFVSATLPKMLLQSCRCPQTQSTGTTSGIKDKLSLIGCLLVGSPTVIAQLFASSKAMRTQSANKCIFNNIGSHGNTVTGKLDTNGGHMSNDVCVQGTDVIHHVLLVNKPAHCKFD